MARLAIYFLWNPFHFDHLWSSLPKKHVQIAWHSWWSVQLCPKFLRHDNLGIWRWKDYWPMDVFTCFAMCTIYYIYWMILDVIYIYLQYKLNFSCILTISLRFFIARPFEVGPSLSEASVIHPAEPEEASAFFKVPVAKRSSLGYQLWVSTFFQWELWTPQNSWRMGGDEKVVRSSPRLASRETSSQPGTSLPNNLIDLFAMPREAGDLYMSYFNSTYLPNICFWMFLMLYIFIYVIDIQCSLWMYMNINISYIHPIYMQYDFSTVPILFSFILRGEGEEVRVTTLVVS